MIFSFATFTSLVFNVRPFNTKDVKKRTSLKPSSQSRTFAIQCLAFPIATDVSRLVCIASKKLVASSRHADISKSRSAERWRHVTRLRCQCEWALKGGCSLAKYDIKKSHLIFWSQSKKNFFRRLSSFWKNQKNPFQLRTFGLDWLTIWWRTSWLAKKTRKLVHNGKQQG